MSSILGLEIKNMLGRLFVLLYINNNIYNYNNMKNLCLVLGDHLFKEHPGFSVFGEGDGVMDYVMIESVDFNSVVKYHKARLYHCFVSMREYADYLRGRGQEVCYVNPSKSDSFFDSLSKVIKGKEGGEGYSDLYVATIDDKEFRKLVIDFCSNEGVVLHWLPSPKFLTSEADWLDYKVAYPKRLMMNDFYVMQRKRLKIFVDAKGNSIFDEGKWSLDSENRKKIPASQEVVSRVSSVYTSKHESAVGDMINEFFKSNPCSFKSLHYPVTHAQAYSHLEEFGKMFFNNFGDYEDALTARDPFLFHSIISPLLNNGMLTPQEVVDWVLSNKNNNVPDNAREGFIRQIIGWREWVNVLYWHVYQQDLSQYNFFKHSKPLPQYFWDKDKLSEIKDNTPLYNALNNVFQYAYCHHIERLMVISNWMVLNEYDPMECYNWFMAMFIDSYNWVMVPNIMGMGLFADGGIFATKPYVSGGNYLKNMSDYKDHKNWESTWTDLFWKFLLKHEEFFKKNPRMSMLISGYKKRMGR
jgi:deoxyribodipyrimidine photolyase-related protein